ncbi:hypothetical protein [Spirillospora sp. NPDC048823]|uniref:hypothetical protein n=1 Tax=unclassified Spirillospora TaxID=2642701 RepID=UPI003721698B
MTSVERVLAKVIMEMVVSIDLSDDENIDPDVAASILEPVAALLQTAPIEDRQAIVELLRDCAEEEQNLERRTTALDLPEALGLL